VQGSDDPNKDVDDNFHALNVSQCRGTPLPIQGMLCFTHPYLSMELGFLQRRHKDRQKIA